MTPAHDSSGVDWAFAEGSKGIRGKDDDDPDDLMRAGADDQRDRQ